MIAHMDAHMHRIRSRYDKLSRFYPLFEYIFLMPGSIRTIAINRLELKSGDRVLEVGCGTGRNFPLLFRAVGPTGRIYGIDASAGMLARARQECASRGWRNVCLIQGDAAELSLPEPIDGAIFSLSYSVIPGHRAALLRAWEHLRPGNHLVMMDAKVPPGSMAGLLRPFSLFISRATVLGNPDKRPWDDLRELTRHVELLEMRRGLYFVCRGTKES